MSTAKYIILSLLILLFSGGNAFAQDDQDFKLARQYYNKKEFKKAREMFQDLYQGDARNGNYYVYYFYCLVQLQDYKEAVQLTKKHSKRYSGNQQYQVDHGYALTLSGERKEAEAVFDEVIMDLPTDPNQIANTARAFESRREFDYAIRAYLKGREIIGDPTSYTHELANLYSNSNNSSAMVDAYIELLKVHPGQLRTVQNNLQKKLEEEDYETLKISLIREIQENPDEMQLAELLIWFFVQRKDFNSAYYQARALDKRFSLGGTRIYSLALVAVENEDFDAALEMLEYISTKEEFMKVRRDAQKEYLKTSFTYLIQKNNYSSEELKELEGKYIEFLDTNGYGLQTVGLQTSFAKLQGIYLANLTGAIKRLEDAIQLPGLDPRTKAQLKLELGDYYLMNGDVWEPTLLYGQVDKDFKDEPLGQEAKYRNARLSFYRGEFDWAQAQFDVLKASTSQKIANDAISLSLLIMDNLALDTIYTTMELFAEAHLLTFRRQFEKARLLFDSLLVAYPYHSITDESWFILADISLKERKIEEATSWYDKILTEYPYDILADDALFRKAELTENYFGEPEKAMLLYQKILLDYPNSLYAITARKRYRDLRGDFRLP